MIGGSQFPSLTALWAEMPPTVSRPKRWGWHAVAEIAFIIGFFAVVIICGGGE